MCGIMREREIKKLRETQEEEKKEEEKSEMSIHADVQIRAMSLLLESVIV